MPRVERGRMHLDEWLNEMEVAQAREPLALVGLAQARKIIHLVEQQPDDVALRLRRQRRLGQRRRQRLPRPRAFPMTATRHLHQLVGAERLLVEPGGVAEVPRSIERSEEHTSELQSLMRIS